jgi:hypothetical protein
MFALGGNFANLILPKRFILVFLIAHIIWWLLYFLVEKFLKIYHDKQKTTHDTKTRIISILHATLIFSASLYDLVYFQTDKCGDTNSEYQNFFITVSFAYFLYDLINCIRLDVSCREMEIHHLFCMCAYYCGVIYNSSANEMMRALVVAEISNPCMHIRVILKNFKLKHSKGYLMLELIYMFLYLTARMFYGTKVVFFTVFCGGNLWIVKIAGGLVWIQSVLFSKRMVGILVNRYIEYQERKGKYVGLFWFSVNKKICELDYYQEEQNKKNVGYIP